MSRLLIALALVACVAAQPKWTVLVRDMEPVLLGIACLDNSTCYMSGGQDGTPPEGGPQVYKSIDGGKTWKWLPHGGFAMMFLDVAAQTKTSAITAGIGLAGIIQGVEYTTNGESFNVSHMLDAEDECQSTMPIAGTSNGFGLAGDFGKANGVAVSFNGGVTFTHYDAKVNTSSRYGDYPTRNTFYVAAGTWPGQGTKAERLARRREKGEVQITQRLKMIQTTNANGEIEHKFEFNTNYTRPAGNDVYQAGLSKSSDGGKTWTQQYWNDHFYFNAISCPTEKICFAVGEAERDSQQPGVRILRTTDGGANWKVVMYNADPTYSLIAMDMVNEKEGWAGGGQLAAPPHFQGHMWHTVDGGDTWKLETLPLNYVTDYSFVGTSAAYKGWATSIDIDTQCSVLVRA